jgi:hypothetical protein
MRFPVRLAAAVAFILFLLGSFSALAAPVKKSPDPLYPDPIDLNVPPITSDKSVRYDYDIVYVRAPRHGDTKRSYWAEIAHPTLMDPGADLMLLHPDGSEEVLVKTEPGCSVADPAVSFDGQWVYYAYLRGLSPKGKESRPQPASSSDIFKINVRTREVVKLTTQTFTPNTGAADWADGFTKPQQGKTHLSYGVINTGPCPLPGGRVMFTSNRNAYRPPRGYPTITLQLFVMDDDGRNVEQIGFLNVAGALHPTILKDGRVLFSSLESQGLHNSILWGIWSIHPDGSAWGPVVSAFDPVSAPNAFHFQTQISDGSLIVEEYYNLNNNGMGAYFKLPPQPADGYPGFGPAYANDPRNPPLRFGRFSNTRPKYYRLPFSPWGIESFTPFANNGEGEADPSIVNDKSSPAVGKFTHPGSAPDNHLLTVWATGPVNHQNGEKLPMPHAGIYLIKSGKPIDSPAQMLLIKNDPDYNEQWPRAVVTYKRIYGVDEPATLPSLANDGKLSPLLPEGTPYGLVGTSSLYKRESYPSGAVPKGSVTATFAAARDPTGGYQGLDPFNTSENGATLNWFNQGADAGKYSNDDIHAIRILIMEPTTDRNRGGYPRDGRLFHSHAMERLRILGEIPVRKFGSDGSQPTDPDGNPDTSFLARIPADTPFTFQTLDRNGMVLNMAQTWHQVRPGEIRNNCGGCHAHSQEPTPFAKTAAAKPDYTPFDLTSHTPLLTARAADQSNVRWDKDNSTGLRFEQGVKNVEYFRDIRPILNRSCTACHNGKFEGQTARLALDSDSPISAHNERPLSETYQRLAKDDGEKSRWGYPPLIHNGSWRNQNASRYVRKFQSRRSLFVWKIYGRRLDGWTNDDFPSETIPGDPNSMTLHGQPVANTPANRNRADLDYNGHPCPPPDAVAGTYAAPDGSRIKVEPLSDEDRLTIVRWIDLGCPIDLDYDAKHAEKRGQGWACDDQRPTLTVTSPRAGANSAALSRILIGACDAYTGLEPQTLSVTADFAVDGASPGTDLAGRFKSANPGVWELNLENPIASLGRATLVVSIKDRQGNLARIERTFSTGK